MNVYINMRRSEKIKIVLLMQFHDCEIRGQKQLKNGGNVYVETPLAGLFKKVL